MIKDLFPFKLQNKWIDISKRVKPEVRIRTTWEFAHLIVDNLCRYTCHFWEQFFFLFRQKNRIRIYNIYFTCDAANTSATFIHIYIQRWMEMICLYFSSNATMYYYYLWGFISASIIRVYVISNTRTNLWWHEIRSSQPQITTNVTTRAHTPSHKTNEKKYRRPFHMLFILLSKLAEPIYSDHYFDFSTK